MLDSAIIEELKKVFSSLEKTVTLKLSRSIDPAQTELEELLRDLTSASDKIVLEHSNSTSTSSAQSSKD